MSDKIKTLSQAIRLGATFRPQSSGGFFTCLGPSAEDARKPAVGSCALGAAYEAITGHTYPADGTLGPLLMNRFHGIDEYKLHEIIECNDTARMTREEIADWLESQGL